MSESTKTLPELLEELDRLKLVATVEFNKGLGECAAAELAVCAAERAVIEEARKASNEIERLRLITVGKLKEASKFMGFEPNEDGSVTALLQTPIFRLFYTMFVELFERTGAKNSVEQGINHEKLGDLIVTVQRVEGLTPHQQRYAAEARAERAEAVVKYAEASGIDRSGDAIPIGNGIQIVAVQGGWSIFGLSKVVQECTFSSICAALQWLQSDDGKAELAAHSEASHE